MKTITLTDEEADLLNELLGIDLDSIGYEDYEIEILNRISDKIDNA